VVAFFIFNQNGKDGKPMSRRVKSQSIPQEDIRIQEFLDMIAPSVVKFNTDHFICGNTYRCVWALREYPTETSEQAILRHLGEKDGVTLHIYTRHVSPVEEKKIISNAANKNRMQRSSTQDLQQTVTAESNLQDVANIVAQMHRSKEPLLHTAVYIELFSHDLDQLKLLQTEVLTELVRSKLNVDRLLLRQQQGFLSVMPSGWNVFGDQFERVLPASSVANLYPFNYSGKTDPNGFCIGRDKFGSNILVDFNRRADDKTNANILILGNSGQGKSYLLKLILTNLRETGMHILTLDPEMEYEELTLNLGGCFIDLMSGEFIINVLEPKSWDENGDPKDTEAPQAFRQTSKLSQHISFLKDFFRTYKDFNDRQIDTIEIMLGRLYGKWGLTDHSNFDRLKPTDYPILSDLYDLIEQEYKAFDEGKRQLYTADILREICLGLHSLCKGAESKFFNGHTNIVSNEFVTFGVKGLLQASKNLRNALLFNILSYMSNELLTTGNTAASIDELYLFLTNLTAIEYIRNFMKRVRKKESAVILASQNLEDFNVEHIRELTKPLFSIPTHQFLFNAGSIDAHFYMDTLQLEKSEYDLIRYPQRGVCLYKCGNERYNLMVQAPEYKSELFGKAGGR
jgi:type IV secretory pathway VirB4 component